MVRKANYFMLPLNISYWPLVARAVYSGYMPDYGGNRERTTVLYDQRGATFIGFTSCAHEKRPFSLLEFAFGRRLRLNCLSRILHLVFIIVLLHGCAGRHAVEPLTSNFRVALVQLDSSFAGNFEEMSRVAKEAKRKGADLVVFPEGSDFGWLNPKVFTEAEPIPGKFSARFAAIAVEADIWVAAGLSERGPEAGSGFFHAFDSMILTNPKGEIVLHHRKHNVLRNAFNPGDCPPPFGTEGCGYRPGQLSDIETAMTPFGRTAILVCADAYVYDKTVLDALKAHSPQLVIVSWGISAGSLEECGREGFNAAEYGAEAAKFLETAYVTGANAIGSRPYGRFLPSWYCGTSGLADPSGQIVGVADTTQNMALFDISIPTPSKASEGKGRSEPPE